jgi:hypothetical protein
MGKLKYNYNRVQFSLRNNQLKDDGFGSYDEFLKSDSWIKLKTTLREKNYYRTCCCCGSKLNIHLHHIKYKEILAVRYIFPLCEICHLSVHTMSREKNISFKVSMRKIRKSKGYQVENRPPTPSKLKTSRVKKVISVLSQMDCPKCRKPMERRRHREIPLTKYFYSEWDYCRWCKHVQHYEEFRNKIL